MIDQHLIELGWNDISTIPKSGMNIYVCYKDSDPRIEFPVRYDVDKNVWIGKAHILDYVIDDFYDIVIGWKHQHKQRMF